MFSRLQDKLSRMCDIYSFLFEQQVLWVELEFIYWVLHSGMCLLIHGTDWTYFPKTVGPLSPVPCELLILWMWHSSSWEEAVSVSSPCGRVHCDFWGWVMKDNPASTCISSPDLFLNLVRKGQNTCWAGRGVRRGGPCRLPWLSMETQWKGECGWLLHYSLLLLSVLFTLHTLMMSPQPHLGWGEER